MGLFLSLYGGLLTERQRQAMELHYSFDLSLTEIAEQMEISRQGVHDLIQRSEQQLSGMEEAVGMGRVLRRVEPRIDRAIASAGRIEDREIRKEIEDSLDMIREILAGSGE